MPEERQTSRLRVVVVGPCASGKSTLAERLSAVGFDAYVCAQEHSEIPTLWRHLGPDIVIGLDVDLATIRDRRGDDWPDTIYQQQRRRLGLAWDAAEIIIDTSTTSADETFARAVDALNQLQTQSASTNTPGH